MTLNGMFALYVESALEYIEDHDDTDVDRDEWRKQYGPSVETTTLHAAWKQAAGEYYAGGRSQAAQRRP